MSVAFKSAVDERVIDELRAIIGDEDRVLPGPARAVNRTRVPAPFPVHRWAEYMPDVAVLPETAEEVSEVVKLANRLRIPVVPRAGGTGLSDGAVPLRGGICVDVKLMNQIHEIDLVDRTVTVGPGINMLKLNEELGRTASSIPTTRRRTRARSSAGGSAPAAGRCSARASATRATSSISMEVVLPTGEIIEVGEAAGASCASPRPASTLKQLFTGHQGTLGICTEATLELVPRPEVEFAAFFAFDDYMKAYGTTGALTVGPRHARRRRAVRRVEGRATCGATTRPTSRSPTSCEAVVAVAHVRHAGGGRAGVQARDGAGAHDGGNYLGDEISPGDWASRHDRYATPLHGARGRPGGADVAGTARTPRSTTPCCRRCARSGTRSSSATRDGTASSTTGDVRLHQRRLQAVGRLPGGDRRRDLGAEARRRELGRPGCAASARSPRWRSSTAARSRPATAPPARATPSSCRPRWGRLGGGQGIKRALDPNNIMNPGKQTMDEAYEDEHLPARRPEAAGAAAHQRRRGERFDHVYEIDPEQMRTSRSRRCRPGTRCGSSPRAGITSTGCTSTSPTRCSSRAGSETMPEEDD